MPTIVNPALEAFVSRIENELVLAQLLIRRAGEGFELRNVADRDTAAEALQAVPLEDLRALAQFTARGAFRPLKSAPNLQAGWRSKVGDSAGLGSALDQLYPGAIADWHAARSDPPPVTHYREFSNRQTGMYRVTAMLGDAQLVPIARACCHKAFCLKHRLWTVDGLTPDALEEKSLIPCLEPCAILLEFARKATRLAQEERMQVDFSAGEIATIAAALRSAMADVEGRCREADFNDPANPRRLRLALERLAALPKPLRVEAHE